MTGLNDKEFKDFNDIVQNTFDFCMDGIKTKTKE